MENLGLVLNDALNNIIENHLRDYFAAHAPKAPGWFEPKMPEPYDKPIPLNKDKWENNAQIIEYNIIYTEEKFFQWRWYYADMMIERSKK